MVTSKLKIDYLSISEIKEYGKNAKLHPREQIEQIKKSIEEYGFDDPIAVDENKVIIEGHGRLIAAKEIDIKTVPVIYLRHLTEEQKKAYRIAHNKINMNSGFDMGMLQAELNEILSADFSIEALGFDETEIDEILQSTNEIYDLGDIAENYNSQNDFSEREEESEYDVTEDEFSHDEAIAKIKEPRTKQGDIWLLGNHRLICGDSTDEGVIKRLMNGKKADMVFTDPPYNVAFNGRSGKFEVIKNDNLKEADFEKFINSVCKIIERIKPTSYYIWCNWKFYSTLQTKLPFKACIVWAKNVFGLGNGYRHQHEFCLFNGTIDENIKNESDLWEVAKDTKYVHPTQKPVALGVRALSNHNEAENIIDLFGGSGSTLIACEKLGRTCYMCEIDPLYCDVIVNRWEALTGNKAIKAA